MMYQGKYFSPRNKRKSHRKISKAGIILLSFLLLLTLSIGGTIAYLVANEEPVTNTFTPSSVTCQVTENFTGTKKSNVNVINTGDTTAYIRVNLVTYRVNDAGQHIGGTATIPTFTLGENWVKYGNYYYYTLPVAPGETPAVPLIGENGIQLSSYTDADGGKQAIEVIAEAIQSSPASAVGQAWGVSISQNGVTAYK